ncbi:MAG: hypothetical protein QW835_06290 [Candidatus Hadarchaeum sp.]
MFRLKFKVRLDGEEKKDIYVYGSGRETMLERLLAENPEIAPTYTEYKRDGKKYYVKQVMLAERYGGPIPFIPEEVVEVMRPKYGEDIFDSIWEIGDQDVHHCDVLLDGSVQTSMEYSEIPAKTGDYVHLVRVCPECRKVVYTIKKKTPEKLVVTAYRVVEKWKREMEVMPGEEAIKILRKEIEEGAPGENYENTFFLVRRVSV